MEVIMRDKRIAQLQRDVEDSAADFGKLKIDLGAYEKHLRFGFTEQVAKSGLTKALATAERNCRHLETDKQRLLREIGAVRDLAHTFDKNREQLQKEYASAKLECDRLVKELDRMHVEHENLANEVRSEKSKYERLESILAMERTKMIVVSAPEKDALLSQQQSSLAMAAQNVANLTEQLHSAQQNVEKLEALSRGHIDELEKQQIQIDKLSRDLEESRSRYVRANSRASMSPRSEAHMNRQETPSQAPQSRIGTPKGESEIEKRIQSELESTKDQLRMYEMQIEDHKSRAVLLEICESLSRIGAKLRDNGKLKNQMSEIYESFLNRKEDIKAYSKKPSSISSSLQTLADNIPDQQRMSDIQWSLYNLYISSTTLSQLLSPISPASLGIDSKFTLVPMYFKRTRLMEVCADVERAWNAVIMHLTLTIAHESSGTAQNVTKNLHKLAVATGAPDWDDLTVDDGRLLYARGEKYVLGLGVPKSYDLAFKAYTASAQCGNPAAMNMLGVMCETGM
ncbi:hypothetical protein HDU78_011837, partial [Chytriomyces hyalinus]